jgi:hypothetical protein
VRMRIEGDTDDIRLLYGRTDVIRSRCEPF